VASRNVAEDAKVAAAVLEGEVSNAAFLRSGSLQDCAAEGISFAKVTSQAVLERDFGASPPSRDLGQPNQFVHAISLVQLRAVLYNDT
jgi:hypothetical protein